MGYEDELDKAHQYAERVRQKQEIKEAKHANDKPLSFSKIAVIFIFVNCLVIEIYSMIVMVVFHDLASLGALVMAVLGQCVGALGYFIKARSENTSGGIIFETTMHNLREQTEFSQEEFDDIDDGAVG